MSQFGNSCVSRSVTRRVGLLVALGLGLLPAISAAQSNPIISENQQSGTAAWDIPTDRVGTDAVGQIKGYASATSVNKGEDITFFVSVNPSQTFTVDVYRIGWYQGLGGRLMQHIGPLNGVKQPSCPTDATTGVIECHWSQAFTLATQNSWTSGIYMAVLTNAQSYQNYITFVVRDDGRVADLIYQQPVTTYQAYNDYPNDGRTGKGLYDYNSYGSTTVGGTKAAVKVSFDRPYADSGISDDFRSWEISFVRWMEKSGYDVAYSTDIDTHTNGERLRNYRGFLSVGHDEYWSKQMFDAAEAARDAGVGLGFFGANAIYWQVRFEPSSNGVASRVMVCYRDPTIDPVSDPNLKTSLWRDPPVSRPEQALIGVQYSGNPPYSGGGFATHVVTNSGNWVYADTGFMDGDGVPGIVGYEADRYFSEYAGPNALSGTYKLLSRSPYPGDYSNSSIYQAPSGAWVFASGTIDWSWALDSYSVGSTFLDARIQQSTANILDRFVANGRTDFILGISPSTRTITPSGSTTYGVTVNPTGGFADQVTLTVMGLPSDASGSFSPNPTTGVSTLSITASATTQPGTYPLTIMGVSGSLVHTTLASLVVSVPDFTVSASPSTQTATAGGSAAYGVTISPTAGFAGQVDLSVSGLPAGASGNFTPNPTTASSTLSVATSASTPSGTYPITITGTSGGLIHSATVSLTVQTGVTVTAPNTAVSWRATTQQNITFTHNQGVGHVMNIDVSRDGGSTWSPITAFTTTSATTGTYSWKVTGPPTIQARVRVTSGANALVTDMSDVDFAIVNPVITVTAPNTAVSWRAGDSKNITFSHNMGIGQTALIDVSRDGGSTWSRLASFVTTSATSGSFAWIVTGPASNQARIRVSWAVDPSVTDMSDVNFKILPRTTVTAPNTAVVWGAGSTRTVSWSHNLGVGGKVDIEFSPDKGATWVMVASAVASAAATTGSYSGPMPTTVTAVALIRVSPTMDPVSGDVSDVPFTLATPAVTVTAPNTNVAWGVGSKQSIKWSHNLGTLESVTIELARDGVNYSEIVAGSVINTALTSGTFSWTVTGPPSATARIRVTWTRNGAVSDTSNVNFRIQ